jgi:hypothetical protein
MEFKYILYFYFTIIVILIYLYINTLEDTRHVITGVVSILSSSTLAIGLINYVSTEKTRQEQENKANQKNYIDFISGSFDKIDNYYINNPEELHSLYYEFYGYSNFPKKYNNSKINDKNNNIINNINNMNNNNKDMNDDTKIDDITSIEYITLLKIIQYIEVMFIINENIFQDLNFRNRIINYTHSKKFRRVLAYNKNNYSYAFLKKMNELKIITTEDIQVENITIPSNI